LNSRDAIVEILKHFSEYRSIYPQLVECELVWTIGVYQCIWRNKIFEVKLTLLWGTLREVIISVKVNDWIWIWHWIHRSYLTELIPRFRFIYIIVGEWYRSHICGRSPYLRCISCKRRRVQSAELASLTTATNYFRPTRILHCIVWLSEVVSLYNILVCRLTCLKLTTKSAIF